VPQRDDIDIGTAGQERGSGSTGWLARSRPIGGKTSTRGLSGRHRRPRGPAPPVLGLPESLRSARFGAPAPALVGVAIMLALAVVVFGVRIAWARAESRPSVVSPSASQRPSALEHGGTTSPALLPASASASGGRASQVVVHVVGQIRRPGVVTLPAGSRVADAVREAGGALPGADLSGVNMARVLVDGEQIRVPKPGEAVPSAGPAGAAGAGPASGGGLVNINSADLATLDTLPGVGPVLAQRILDWRAEHGRFSTVEELGEVSGIGDKLLAQLTPKVTV
jgi:competence protein ComEA